MNVIVLNAGSSSLKFQIIATDLERIRQGKDQLLCRGEVEGTGGEAIITFQNGDGEKHKFTASLRDVAAALDYLVRYITSDQSGVDEIHSTADIHAVGHRVVHGGELFTESARIDDKVVQGNRGLYRPRAAAQSQQHQVHTRGAGHFRQEHTTGSGIRYFVSYHDSAARLSLCPAVPPLSPV